MGGVGFGSIGSGWVRGSSGATAGAGAGVAGGPGSVQPWVLALAPVLLRLVLVRLVVE